MWKASTMASSNECARKLHYFKISNTVFGYSRPEDADNNLIIRDSSYASNSGSFSFGVFAVKNDIFTLYLMLWDIFRKLKHYSKISSSVMYTTEISLSRGGDTVGA